MRVMGLADPTPRHPPDLLRKTAMTDALPPSSPSLLRTAALSHRKITRFRLAPDADSRAALAASLDLIDLPEVQFEGEIAPAGRADFALTGRLRARAVQACVISLAPVPARIDEQVTRRFVAELDSPDGDEVEIPEDDSLDPLPEVIDLIEVLREALALALPPYPRAKGATLGEAVFAPPGAAPLRDDDLRPFAGLAGLVGKRPPEDGQTGE
jgi:uncharacterized metal-binding protein YceD (DUF177 family)